MAVQKRRLGRFLVGAWSLAISSYAVAQAEAYSGLWLKLCMDKWEKMHMVGSLLDPQEAGDAGYYAGYVNGIVNALTEISICPPKVATYDQAHAVVAKYLKNNPEKWIWPPYLLVSTPLIEAFPCTAK